MSEAPSARSVPPVVGGLRGVAGEVVRGWLTIGRLHDEEASSIPISIASGTTAGPVLWVQAGTHGDEVGGTLALHELLAQLDLQDFRGAIICAMAANHIAFAEGRRTAANDGHDLNRAFPGKWDGTYVQRTAHRLTESILGGADAFIDLHSGGFELECCHHVITPKNDTCKAFSRSLGSSKVWELNSDELPNAAISTLAARGVPAAIVESGSARVAEDDLRLYLKAIFGACVYLKQIKATPNITISKHYLSVSKLREDVEANGSPVGGSYTIVTASVRGIFVSTVAAGSAITAGALVGHVVSVFGDVLEEIHSPAGWLAARRLSPSSVCVGDMLAEVVH